MKKIIDSVKIVQANGAEGGSRTHNLVRGSVFETDAYVSSATSAKMDLSGLEPLTSEALYQLSYRPEKRSKCPAKQSNTFQVIIVIQMRRNAMFGQKIHRF